MVKLDIFSDPICPWCYIGKTLLDRALQEKPGHPFDIEWHPFQLNPDMDPDGMDRREYLEHKFGGRDGAVRVYGQIDDRARELGIEWDLSKITRTPNTLDAHRLIFWAHLEERQNQVQDLLFKAYFAEGHDIGEHDILIDIAIAAGMDGLVVKKLLASDSDKQSIMERDHHARQKGVQAVPTFVVANQHVVSGAQPPELWKNVIADIEKMIADDNG